MESGTASCIVTTWLSSLTCFGVFGLDPLGRTEDFLPEGPGRLILSWCCRQVILPFNGNESYLLDVSMLCLASHVLCTSIHVYSISPAILFSSVCS